MGNDCSSDLDPVQGPVGEDQFFSVAFDRHRSRATVYQDFMFFDALDVGARRRVARPGADFDRPDGVAESVDDVQRVECGSGDGDDVAWIAKAVDADVVKGL